LFCQTRHCFAKHAIVLPNTPLFCKTRHCSAKHAIVLPNTPLFWRTRHCSGEHAIVLENTPLFCKTCYCFGKHVIVLQIYILFRFLIGFSNDISTWVKPKIYRLSKKSIYLWSSPSFFFASERLLSQAMPDIHIKLHNYIVTYHSKQYIEETVMQMLKF
jgi:hypothetical protein